VFLIGLKAGILYRGDDKSLARPGRKKVRKHVRNARNFNNIETRAVIKSPPQGKAPKEIHAILTETLVCFLPGRAKNLSAPLYYEGYIESRITFTLLLVTERCFNSICLFKITIFYLPKF